MKLNVSIVALAALLMVAPSLAFDKSLLRPLVTADPDANPEARIVGGAPAAQGGFPSYAIPPGAPCGATLIYEDILLSAAHCEGSFKLSTIYIGGNQMDGSDAVDSIRASEERVHPNFNSNTFSHDFMLVKLSSPSTSQPMQLNTVSAEPADGESVKVIGYGLTSDGGSQSNDLLQVTVQVDDFATCNSDYGGDIDSDTMICASANGKDSCNGDSGGPLLNAQGVQVGVVSFGVGCAQGGYPGVYSRVSSALDFISQGICEMSSNPPASCNGSGGGGIPDTSTPVVDVTCDACTSGLGGLFTGQVMHVATTNGCKQQCVTSMFKFLREVGGWVCGSCPI